MSNHTVITVPASLVPQLEEWGRLTAKVFGQLRRIALTKPKGISKDQKWYWSKKWQEWEREADEAEAHGNYKDFESAKDAISYLHSRK